MIATAIGPLSWFVMKVCQLTLGDGFGTVALGPDGPFINGAIPGGACWNIAWKSAIVGVEFPMILARAATLSIRSSPVLIETGGSVITRGSAEPPEGGGG